MKSIWCILCLILVTTTVRAETTGNTVLDNCQKAIQFYENDGGMVKDQFVEGWCIGWVDSALSLNGINAQWRDVTKARPGLMEFCTPTKGIPVIQGVRVVVKYLIDHPDQLHMNGMTVTVMALKDAFPCKS